MTDEIIAEMHAIKDALSKRFEGDVRAILDDIEMGKQNCVPLGSNLLLHMTTAPTTTELYPRCVADTHLHYSCPTIKTATPARITSKAIYEIGPFVQRGYHRR